MSPNFIIQAAPFGKFQLFCGGGPRKTQFHGGFLAGNMAARGDAQERETMEHFSSALAQFTSQADDLKERILDGERGIRNDREALARLGELAESERAVAQIAPEEKAKRGQENLES